MQLWGWRAVLPVFIHCWINASGSLFVVTATILFNPMGQVEKQPAQVSLPSNEEANTNILIDDTKELNGKNTQSCLGPALQSSDYKQIKIAGEIPITSDMQMTPPLWQKVKKN